MLLCPEQIKSLSSEQRLINTVRVSHKTPAMKRPFGRYELRCKDSIKVNLTEIRFEVVGRIYLNLTFVWSCIITTTNKIQLFRLLIFLNQPNMFRAANSPIFRSTFWLNIQLLVQWTDTDAYRCHGWEGTDVPSQPWHRCCFRWAGSTPETCRANWNY